MLIVNGDEIVISGIAGRFPESDNIYEFWEALVNGDDLTTSNDRRWPVEYMGVPPRCGNVKNAEKFDAQFFGIDDMTADSIDPQLRLFYEVVYETICDAGIIPTELKGSNTAIVLGLCHVDTSSLIGNDVANENSEVPMYTRKTPAIVSQFFEFTGPAVEIDSACASSYSALFEGVQLMKSGQCDKLIVGGASINLSPHIVRMYQDLKIISPDGKSRCLDALGNGFSRSEAVVAILVEQKKDAKRIYASIKAIETNNDGYNPEGITFPNYEAQKNLMESVMRKMGLNPLDVNYIESHITGTEAGDTIEGQSMFDAYRSGSEKPIMFGCLKSNIGHTEEVSALCALTKVAIMFQKHCVPPNRHYVTPNPNIPGLITGQIIPVLEKMRFDDEIVPINSFGFGGVNTHAVVEANNNVVTEDSFKVVENFARLVNISGRTEEGLEYAMKWIECNRKDITKEFLALLNDVSKTPLETGMYCRAFMLFDKERVLNKAVFRAEKRRPLWFVFSALDSQWKGMFKELSFHPVFVNSLRKCAQVTDTVGVNLPYLIENESTDIEQNIITASVSIVCIQIALIDFLRYVGIIPDGIIGYSIGEIAAAYADGCLTLEEAVLTSFYTAKCIKEYQKWKGAMAAVALNWKQGLARCPPGVTPACDDSVDGITVSGSNAVVLEFVEQLKQENIVAKVINSCEISYHSPLAVTCSQILASCLDNVIKHPKLKSSKMISTSNDFKNVRCDATYFASNIVSPVMFRKAASQIPKNACIVEIGPSPILLPILKRSITNCVAVALMGKNCCGNVENILSGIGRIYCSGNNVKIEELYPKVKYPVPRETLSLSHLLKWDHSKSYFVANYMHMVNNIKARVTKNIDITSKEWSFIAGHCIDGRILFPASGYFHLVWSQYTLLMTADTKFSFPVEFRDVVFKQANVITSSRTCVLDIAINETTGRFKVIKDGMVCVTGYVGIARCAYDDSHNSFHTKATSVATMNREGIYREFRIRGYDYGKTHQVLEEVAVDGSYGKANWTGNWMTFMDAVLQLPMLASKERLLMILNSVEYLQCDPDIFFKATKCQDTFDIFFDEKINQINTNGICVKGIKVSAIQRRTDSQIAKLTYQCFSPYNLIVESTKEQKVFVEEYFQKCINLLQKLSLKEWHVTEDEDNCSFNVDSNDLFLFYKRLIVALREKQSFERFFDSLTEIEKKTVIFEANKKDMLIVQLKQVMENMRQKLFIVEVNDTEAELKNSVIRTVENYLMNYEYDSIQTVEVDNNTPLNLNEVDLVIYKHVSTELITDEKVLKNEDDLSALFNLFEKMITEDGFLLITCRTKLTSLEREIFTLRNSPQPQLLTESNIIGNIPNCFTLFAKRRDDFGVVSCIFKKMSKPRLPHFIKPQYDCFDWVENMKRILKEEKENKVIWLLAKESEFHGVFGLTRCLKKEQAGLFRCFISDEAIPEFVLKNDLMMNVFKNGCYGVYIYQECVELKKDVQHSYLDIKTKGDLSTFRLRESCHNNSHQFEKHEKEETLINVYYSALNSKDVMIALGRIPHNAYPPGWHNDGNLGSEYSGIDENGNKVMGIAKINGIATTLIAKKSDLCWPVPIDWSLEEAVTIPLVYITVYYALLLRAKLKAYEKVLIHSGCGGVGQAAISVCLSMNCEVFTSVGSENKKQFLKNKFPQLQDMHFVNSRDMSFEEHILKLTDGKGVDVILNSLSEEKLRASINCLAEFGRFIEIGKFDIIQNNLFDSSMFQRNQSFHSICTAHLFADYFDGYTTEIDEICTLIQTGLRNGYIKPLNSTVFDMNEAEKAFRYMASGKHIGKVLIRIRDEKTEIVPKPIIVSSTPHTYCSPLKVYILFGCLGGLGLQVALWLAKRGAKKLVITSRKGIKDDYQRYVVNKIESAGVTVNIVVNDASTYEKTEYIIKEALKMGPIGGIFNLAMILKDALINDQTPELFEEVCVPKINTTLYADQISRRLIQNLDYFVCFSSLTSATGSSGQSNYGYANSVLESICEKRREDGLHAVAVAYGPVGDTGTFHEQIKTNDIIFQGCLPQRMPSFLASLEKCINSKYAICKSTVVAPKVAHSTEGRSNKNIMNTICHILGVDHSVSLDDNLRLVHLGMDSMMSAAIIEAIEREFNILISTEEVRQLTIKEFKDLSKNRKS